MFAREKDPMRGKRGEICYYGMISYNKRLRSSTICLLQAEDLPYCYIL